MEHHCDFEALFVPVSLDLILSNRILLFSDSALPFDTLCFMASDPVQPFT
jgi:hypothetical protein